MSDTPRTNAEAFFPHDSKYQVCDSDFARQLERELNAAQDRIKRLDEFVDQLTNPKSTRDDLPKEALLQRIKRLEEVWDSIECLRVDLVAEEKWRKAREAKP